MLLPIKALHSRRDPESLLEGMAGRVPTGRAAIGEVRRRAAGTGVEVKVKLSEESSVRSPATEKAVESIKSVGTVESKIMLSTILCPVWKKVLSLKLVRKSC